MRVPVLLPHHDVEHIGCPSCGQPAVLSNSPRRRRREWTCPTCRAAAGTVRIAGHWYAGPAHPPTRCRCADQARTPLPPA